MAEEGRVWHKRGAPGGYLGAREVAPFAKGMATKELKGYLGGATGSDCWAFMRDLCSEASGCVLCLQCTRWMLLRVVASLPLCAAGFVVNGRLGDPLATIFGA